MGFHFHHPHLGNIVHGLEHMAEHAVENWALHEVENFAEHEAVGVIGALI